MLASVRYRLPGETLVHEIGTKHPPKRCTSLAEIPPQKGYLFAPFQENDAHPLWFIPADEQRTWTQPTEVPNFSLAYEEEEDHRMEYMRAFEACQAAFQQSELQKVVLSRTLSVHFDQNLTTDDYYRLFEQACIAYPNSFVSLISLPAPWGTWLNNGKDCRLLSQPRSLVREKSQGTTMGGGLYQSTIRKTRL